ncbi:hypothetical protein BOX15_Mlig012196g6, partial [Macrostomum lignano]
MSSSANPTRGDKFPDLASVESLADKFSNVKINDDAYSSALADVEAALLANQSATPGLVQFACHTKLLHCLIGCASRQSDATAAARGLSAAAGLLRALPPTLRVECLRDELPDCLAEAAAQLLAVSAASRASDSPVRRALTDLTLAVLGNRAKLTQCFELAHCQLYGKVLTNKPAAPLPAPPKTAATDAVLTATRLRDHLKSELPAASEQPQPQVGKPATVCYSELVGR